MAAKQVTAFVGYAIYADYDANAPDTQDLILCDTEELAIRVCDHLNEEPRKWGNLAFVDGWEHTKSFALHKTFRDTDVFETSFDDIIRNATDDDE